MTDDVSRETEAMKRGAKGERVGAIQKVLVARGFKVAVDDDYGPQTEQAVTYFQQYWMISDDGVVGHTTRAKMQNAIGEEWKQGDPRLLSSGVWVYGWRHPRWGLIPDRRGKTSTFGGPDDYGDRRLGQARIHASTAAEIYSRYAGLVDMGLFRKDENGEPFQDPLPTVTGIALDGSRGEGTASASWMLNPDSYYCAMRWKKGGHPEARTGRVVFFLEDRVCVTVPSDFGPARWSERNSDLSPGTLHDALRGKTDDVVRHCWAADFHPIGVPPYDDWTPA